MESLEIVPNPFNSLNVRCLSFVRRLGFQISVSGSALYLLKCYLRFPNSFQLEDFLRGFGIQLAPTRTRGIRRTILKLVEQFSTNIVLFRNRILHGMSREFLVVAFICGERCQVYDELYINEDQ